MQIKLELSTAECNCILEAITAANSLVANGQQVYIKDGYQSEMASVQLQHAAVTAGIAEKLQQIIAEEEVAIIVFEP